MTISKSALPGTSMLKAESNAFDFVDCFKGDFYDRDGNISSAEVGRAFFSSGPQWVSHLFTFRNKLAGLFGLKTPGNITGRQQKIDHFQFEQGAQLGLFKVYGKTANEIVLGEDDKHLNFRVSLFIQQQTSGKALKTLIISTAVTFNNGWGRLYFLPVKPFHKLIVPAMLRGIIKNIERKN